jgi:hypothetical protein
MKRNLNDLCLDYINECEDSSFYLANWEKYELCMKIENGEDITAKETERLNFYFNIS